MLKLDFNLAWTVINLIIIYLLMKKFLFSPVQKIIAQRQQEADEAYAKAQSSLEEADSKKAEYEQSLKDIDGLKADAVTKAQREATMEYQKVIDEANAKAKNIVENAKVLANQEKQKIMKSAQIEVADIVLDATAKIAASKKDTESDKALYDQFISQTRKDM